MSQLVPIYGVPALSHDQIQSLEDMIRMLGEPQPWHWVEEQVHGGLYIRKFEMRAGTLAIGKRHKVSSFTVLARGAVTLWDGSGVQHLAAPHYMTSMPGHKRVAYAHTDFELLEIYPTALTDLAEIAESLVHTDGS